MIQRYSLPRMSAIWSQDNKFRKMLEVEILACEAMAREGLVPKSSLDIIKKRAKFDVERIRELEKQTNHDVVAFILNLSENIGEDARYLHMGLTSSDVLDTSLSVLMKEASAILIEDVKRLMLVLRKKARRYRFTVMMGRTHGVHAEPTTFGLKMALFYDEMNRNLDRLKSASDVISVGKISGAVGTYANAEPFVESYVCKNMGLRPANISTQILQRDRHAQYLAAIAIVGSSLEKFAVEFRNLQRTEINEVEESFQKGQKGSSAMPHKKNPITLERITGLSRVLRGNAQAAMESVALWHERDISHSSVERVVVPDSTILLDYLLVTFMDVLDKLVVHEDIMRANIFRTKGIIFSQKVLLKLIEKGFTRVEAYNMVQEAAMRVRAEEIDFQQALLANIKISSSMSKEEIDGCFDLEHHTKHINKIFKKVGI